MEMELQFSNDSHCASIVVLGFGFWGLKFNPYIKKGGVLQRQVSSSSSIEINSEKKWIILRLLD